MSDSPVPTSPAQSETLSHPNHRGDILFTVGLLLALYVGWQVRRELILIYVSALFAVVLMPVLRGIMKLRIGKWSPGRGSAIFILFLVITVGIVLFVSVALPPVIHDLHEFAKEMPTKGPELLARIRRLPFSDRIDVNALNSKLQDIASNFVAYIFYSISDWARTLFDIITGIILTVYFVIEGETAYFWLLSFVPSGKRERLNSTMVRAQVRMGKWLLGQGVLMLILGVLSTIVFLALHIRYAYALGVLMGLFNIIPVIGALISVALVVLVAAIDSWAHVVGVLIFYTIYSQIETSFLTPRIMRTSVDLASLAVLIALLLGSALAGVIGAMVSVPTAVLVTVLLDEYAVKPEPAVLPTQPPAEIH